MGDTPRDRMKQREAEIKRWETAGEVMTPSQKFDIVSESVQTVPVMRPEAKTLHRGKKSKQLSYRKGGMVKNGRDYCK